MFYYIYQTCTPSFPIGLVKTKSDFIVRSVETDLGRWMLVVAVIRWISRCFLVVLCHLIVTTQVVTKSFLRRQVKIWDSFSAMSHMEKQAYSFFWCCGYFQGPWVSFVTTDEFSVRVTKITALIGVSWTHSLPFCFNLFLTQWIMAMLSKRCKPDNFEPHNSWFSLMEGEGGLLPPHQNSIPPPSTK